jgi:hypothetical protein
MEPPWRHFVGDLVIDPPVRAATKESCDPESSAERLQGLRALMKVHQLDAYLVTSQEI